MSMFQTEKKKAIDDRNEEHRLRLESDAKRKEFELENQKLK